MLRSPTLFAAVHTYDAFTMQTHTVVAANANPCVCGCTYVSTLINLLLYIQIYY